MGKKSYYRLNKKDLEWCQKRKEKDLENSRQKPHKMIIENFKWGSLRCIRSHTSASGVATWSLVCLATKPHVLYWTACLLYQFVKRSQLLPWEVFSESRNWCKVDSNTTHGFRNGLETAIDPELDIIRNQRLWSLFNWTSLVFPELVRPDVQFQSSTQNIIWRVRP